MIVTDFIKQIKKVGIKTLTGVPFCTKAILRLYNGVGKEDLHLCTGK